MKNIGLLTLTLLLGTASMAQEAKTTLKSSSKTSKEVKTEQIKSSALSETTAETKVEHNKGVKETKDGAAAKLGETHETVVTEATNALEGKDKEQAMSELTGSVVAGNETEGSTDNHGTIVSGLATTSVEAGSKGTIVSNIASATGKLQSATNSIVKSVNVTSQAAVKSLPKVNVNVGANTKVDIQPVKVITNTKIRTGISIK